VGAKCASSKAMKIKRHRATKVHKQSRGDTTRAEWNSQYEVTDKRNTQGPDGSRTPVFKPIMLAKILQKCSGFKCDNYMKK